MTPKTTLEERYKRAIKRAILESVAKGNWGEVDADGVILALLESEIETAKRAQLQSVCEELTAIADRNESDDIIMARNLILMKFTQTI